MGRTEIWWFLSQTMHCADSPHQTCEPLQALLPKPLGLLASPLEVEQEAWPYTWPSGPMGRWVLLWQQGSQMRWRLWAEDSSLSAIAVAKNSISGLHHSICVVCLFLACVYVCVAFCLFIFNRSSQIHENCHEFSSAVTKVFMQTERLSIHHPELFYRWAATRWRSTPHHCFWV